MSKIKAGITIGDPNGIGLEIILSVFEDLSIYPFEKLVSKESKYLNWLKEFNFNPLPSNLSFSGNFFRSLYTQKFREINYSGVNSNSQIPIPELSQKKFLFDWRLSLSQNLTKSIRVNYNASNSNIVPSIDGKQSDLNSSDMGIFDNFFNIGDPDYFNQNFSINYSGFIRTCLYSKFRIFYKRD